LKGFEPAGLQEEGLQDYWIEVPEENFDLKQGISNKSMFQSIK